MAYVPGYQHDIFISYAHGDDRDWVNRFLDRLKPAIKQRLGVEARIWIDDDNLRRTRDFEREIPESVKASALFLFFPSPTYIRSQYCVFEECRTFKETLGDRRARFSSGEFANEQFALRCPFVPVENNEHWQLFEGLTDISFCNESDTFAIGTPEFEASFRRLIGEVVMLLKRMRNHSMPVFLYPPNPPGSDLKEIDKAITDELSAHGYRLLPDHLVNLPGQLREASLCLFLLGDTYNETARDLAEIASKQGKPWVVWSSPVLEQKATVEQLGFCKYLEQLDSATKTYLDASIALSKLKEEVLALLRPSPRELPPVEGKPRVYLIYNSRDRQETVNASLIVFHYRTEFHFDYPDDPGQHTLRLANSDGVLVVWGKAEEDWCSREFEAMIQTSRCAHAKGLCVFDPKDVKTTVLDQIRQNPNDLHIIEQFGKFEPSRMEAFFNSIRRRRKAGQP